jgi:hypothetical protein
MIFNGVQIFANQTITILNVANFTNQLVCASVFSKPDVSLTLYATNSSQPLSTPSNSNNTKQCLSTNVCTNILYVYFQSQNNQFNSLSSISCSANSVNPVVPLLSVISRNITFASKHLSFITLFVLMYTS